MNKPPTDRTRRYEPKTAFWRTPAGDPLSCVEKLKVLDENIEEIRQLAQDALEDALLMGCDEAQVRAVLAELISELHNPYRTGAGKK
ncbi:MAG: hypothetical protein RLP16_07200 [Alphaproteobacteria bacterium]